MAPGHETQVEAGEEGQLQARWKGQRGGQQPFLNVPYSPPLSTRGRNALPCSSQRGPVFRIRNTW